MGNAACGVDGQGNKGKEVVVAVPSTPVSKTEKEVSGIVDSGVDSDVYEQEQEQEHENENERGMGVKRTEGGMRSIESESVGGEDVLSLGNNRSASSNLSQDEQQQQQEAVIIAGRYRVIRSLGHGVSGDVLVVEDIQNFKRFALKRLDRNDKWSDALFFTEAKFLQLLKEQKYVIRIIRTFADSKYYYLLTELGLCDLYSRIKKDSALSEKLAKVIIRKLLEQLVVMHQHNVVHRDIKPENVIFVDEKGTEPKLIDFGDALVVDTKTEYNELVGTPCYLSPERWETHEGWQLKASDVWAIGVMTYEIVTGKRCFIGETHEQIRAHVEKGKWRFPKECPVSELCEHFIHSLLTRESYRRPSARLALYHPWLCPESNDLSKDQNIAFLEKAVQQWNQLTEITVPKWSCYTP